MPKESPHDHVHRPSAWERPFVPWIILSPLAIAAVVLLVLVMRRDQHNPAREAAAAAYAQSEFEAAQRDNAAREARRPAPYRQTD